MQWVVCVCVCLCVWAAPQAARPSLLLGLHWVSSRCHRAWWIPCQPWALTMDAAHCGHCLCALGPGLSNISPQRPYLTHPQSSTGLQMPQARLQRHGVASLCPSLLSDPCGWVARPEAAPFSRLCCWGARFWLSGLEPRDPPLLLPPCSARGGLPAGAPGSRGQADPAWHGLSVPLVPWHGSGPMRGLGEARGASCGRGDSPAHPEACEAGLWHPWARCLRGDPA